MTGLFKRPGCPSAEDDERLTRLYQETRGDLLAFLLRRCATAEDAADCLAETYRVAWEKRKRIPAGPEARPWLFGVARNAAREKHRSRERQTATTHALALAAENSYIGTTPGAIALAAALSELSALDREIVMMLSADGLGSREVGSVLGLSPTAVRSRAHRARQKLRARLISAEADDAPSLPDAISTTASHAS
jgi:RNA polymerase sigma-70 factor, ECF subfamily